MMTKTCERKETNFLCQLWHRGINVHLARGKCSQAPGVLTFIIALAIWIACFLIMATGAWAYTNDEIANAIYKAEGGTKTSHPYGILTHYKHTTPRQACLNTIAHARRDFKGGDFIEFLGSRYCPVNCDNDNGTNKYWVKNVKYFLNKVEPVARADSPMTRDRVSRLPARPKG